MAGPLSANMGEAMAPNATTSIMSCFFRPNCRQQGTAYQTQHKAGHKHARNQAQESTKMILLAQKMILLA
jgi:hypothetical protein